MKGSAWNSTGGFISAYHESQPACIPDLLCMRFRFNLVNNLLMKKIWSYVAIFFIGVSAGLVAMYKLAGEQIVVNVKKQRIWGRGNEMNTTVPIEVDNANLPIQTKRVKRKQAGVIRRNRRKLKRLDKL